LTSCIMPWSWWYMKSLLRHWRTTIETPDKIEPMVTWSARAAGLHDPHHGCVMVLDFSEGTCDRDLIKEADQGLVKE
jgi:hypothetical protein